MDYHQNITYFKFSFLNKLTFFSLTYQMSLKINIGFKSNKNYLYNLFIISKGYILTIVNIN